MKSLKNIFHKKQKQEPKPLRVEDVAPAPMTPEPDDAELAAMALLEKMAEIKGVSRNNDTAFPRLLRTGVEEARPAQGRPWVFRTSGS